MRINRRVIAIAAAVGALGVTGAGIAYAVGGDSEEQATGPGAEKAKSAALEAVGGGTVIGVEREDGDGSGVYEVEVNRDDGSQVEVAIGDRNQSLGTASDDDTGSESNEGENEGAED
ncbi:MAG: PepSY domain-containing protein [Actinomycetota bacterium]